MYYIGVHACLWAKSIMLAVHAGLHVVLLLVLVSADDDVACCSLSTPCDVSLANSSAVSTSGLPCANEIGKQYI